MNAIKGTKTITLTMHRSSTAALGMAPKLDLIE
jgi:hypothetical protein